MTINTDSVTAKVHETLALLHGALNLMSPKGWGTVEADAEAVEAIVAAAFASLYDVEQALGEKTKQ